MANRRRKPTIPQRAAEPKTTLLLFCVLLGLVFLTESDAFYNLNHYKIVAALAGALIFLAAGVVSWTGFWKHGFRMQHTNSASGVTRFLLLLLLLPILATLPGTIFSGARYAYFFEQEVITWLVCCSWLFLILYSFKNGAHLLSVPACLALLVCITSWVAIANYFDSSNDFSLNALNRESGTFGNPNYFAAYLSLQLPLFLVCSLPRVGAGLSGRLLPKLRLFFFLAFISGSIALVLTQARTSQLTFLASLSILYLAMFWRPEIFGVKRKLLLGILTACFVAVAAALIFLPVIDYVIERIRFGSTPSSRLVPWRAAWTSILAAPWVGWGAGSSYSLFFQYVDPESRIEWFERSFAHPHNEYLEILQEGGILALAAYFLLMGYFAVVVTRLFVHQNLHARYKLVLTGLCLGIFSYHMLAIVSVAPRMLSVRLILFFLLAMVLWIQRLSTTGDDSNKNKHKNNWQLYASQAVSNKHLLGLTLAMLVFSFVLYAPVGISRYRFVEILQSPGNLQQMSALQEHRENRPNVYALDLLIQQELIAGEFESAQRSLEALDLLIPNYSVSGYFNAVNAMLQDNENEAKKLAEAYQSRDRYHSETAFLLSKIAILNHDPKILLKQLPLILKPLLITESAIGLRKEDSFLAVIEGEEVSATLVSLEGQSQLNLNFSESALNELMLRANTILSNPADERHIESYRSVIGEKIENMVFSGFSIQQQTEFKSHLKSVLEDLGATSL